MDSSPADASTTLVSTFGPAPPLQRVLAGPRTQAGLRLGSSLTSFATAWLFSVITTSSPGDRLWIRSGSFA